MRERLGDAGCASKMRVSKELLYEAISQRQPERIAGSSEAQRPPLTEEEQKDVLYRYYYLKTPWYADLETKLDVSVSGKCAQTTKFALLDKLLTSSYLP